MTKPDLIPSGIPFTQFPNEAITDPALDIYDRNVLLYLFMRANSQARSWPSQRTIEKDTGISRNKVMKSLRILEEEGWISTRSAPNAPNAPIEHKQRHIYVVHGHRTERITPPEPARGEHRRVGSTGASQDITGAPDAPEPARGARHNNTHKQHPEQHPMVDEPKTAIRKPDLLWEAVVEIHGDPATDTERGKLNRAVGDLRKAGVTPDEYPQLVAAFMAKYSRNGQPGPQPTAITIATRIGEMRHFIKRGPIHTAAGTLDDLVSEQKRLQDLADLEAQYGADGKRQRIGDAT